MADEISIKVHGVDELKAALALLPERLRRRALTNALRAGGRVIRDEAKIHAPVLAEPTPRRKPGTVREAITVRTSKFARQRGEVGVFIGVRPLRGSRQKKLGRAGARNPNDPYYWRFVEFGTKKMGAQPFLGIGARKLNEALAVFMRQAVPAIEKLNKPGR
jgi:HK97 gp10 family phage protein